MVVSYRELCGFLGKFLVRQKALFFFIFFLDALAWPAETLILPYILSLVVDAFTLFEENRSAAWGALQAPILGAIGLILFVEIVSRTMGFFIGKAIPKLQRDIRLEMFDHIQRHSPRYFNERFAGSLANRVTDMTTQVEILIQQLFWPIWPAFIGCLGGVVILWLIQPLFAWIFLAWITVHLLIVFKFTRPVDAYEERHGEARTTLLGKIVDSFTNNFAVNLFYRFKEEKHSLLPFQEIEEKTNIQAKYYAEKMTCVTSLFYLIGIFLLINGSLIYFWLHDQITTGQAVQVFNMMYNITGIMWLMGKALPTLFHAFGSAKQAYVVMRDPQDIQDRPSAKDLNIQKGEIAFENVSFGYGEKELFQNKNVFIRGGEKIGLVGFTGSGKSTFINLILRFFPLNGGKIFIDNQEIAGITLESLRRQIALIPQDPILFHRSLRENIAYGKPEATESEVYSAAKLAHCDTFIRSLSSGYETKVGERGTKLSGGEKQRVAIARAILSNAPILILDEATSALDSVTEKYIQESLDALMQNRTALVIAHRLSTLFRMDRILVFDQGKIVEEGTHDALMNKGGLYARMWSMQAGGFLPENA